MVNTKYRYWRFRIMYSMMTGYAGFYLIRQNLSMAIPSMQAELGYSKVQIGIILSTAAIIYGFGKGVVGVISDKSNARYFMTIGLLCSAVMNLFMGFSSSLFYLILFWALNSCFQSMGWPPCARLLTHWFSQKEIATKWAIWNMSQQIGGAIVLVMGGYLIERYSWRYAFFIPSFCAVGLAIFLFNRLRDTPRSLGLPPIEEYHGLQSSLNDDEEHLSMREILLNKVLKNKLVWYVCLANFFVYVVRMSVFNWAPTILKEFKGSSLYLAGWQTATYDLAGMFGGLVAGSLSDRLFHGRRGRVGCICMMFLSFAVTLFWLLPKGSPYLDFIAMTIIGFLISGPQILVGVAAADFASKKAAGAATGLTGTVGYIGTAFAGVGIGSIVEYFGWDIAFMTIIGACILSAFFFALTWNHRSAVLEKSSQYSKQNFEKKKMARAI
ncbi:MAG: MFS transporter [Alphaproteobacteria bacterium]